MTFQKYLRAAAEGKSTTHQLSSHCHQAPPASGSPVAHACPLWFDFIICRSHIRIQLGRAKRGEGFSRPSPAWGAGTEATRRGGGPGGTSHERSCCSSHGARGGPGGPGAPQGGGCQPSCPGGCKWPGMSGSVPSSLSTMVSQGKTRGRRSDVT